MGITVLLRDVTQSDLPTFFEQQRDAAANDMAGFTAQDPTDWNAFAVKWARILADEAIVKKAIVADGRVVGNVLCFVAPWSGQREVSYWLGREFWGKGIATQAIQALLRSVTTRPLYARAAKDNVASIRVLEKCGFTRSGDERGFANARCAEIDEVILKLNVAVPPVMTLDRVTDLAENDLEDIRRLSQAVYPPALIANWPARQVQWSTPEWCIRIRGSDGSLLSYVGIYVRDAECEGLPIRIGGVGNVKTHPLYRAQGMAALGIRQAIEFFRTQPGVEFALLVCEPHLLGYYGRLGWCEFGGRLVVRQHGVSSEFTLGRVMTCEVRSESPAAGNIDLCGPPW